LARIFEEGGSVLTQLYDVAIFAPLWVEKRVANLRGQDLEVVGARQVMKEAQTRLSSKPKPTTEAA
ncbi:MAG: hypothetical protein AAGG79_00050, partial [Pseudomonadota bacterium]